MLKFLIIPAILTVYFWALNATAQQPTNPTLLCERFVGEPEKQKCLNFLSKTEPDWYLATVCEKIFDDKLFYDCLSLSEKYNFPPDQVASCNVEIGEDTKIMSCLQSVAAANPELADAYQRSPASTSKNNKSQKPKKNK